MINKRIKNNFIITLIEFNECNCCFDDVYEYIKCNHGHLTCKECIFAGVKNAVGENKKLLQYRWLNCYKTNRLY